MKKDIFIILPFKESLNPNYAGAVSLYVKDTTYYSKFKKRISIISSDNFKNQSQLFRNRNYIINFCEKYKFSNIKIIEIHNRPEYYNYIKKYFPTTKIKLIFHNDPLSLRGSISLKERDKIINGCDKVIFISRWIQQRFFTSFKNANLSRTLIIPHGINKNVKTNLLDKEKNILFVGKLNHAKGYHIFSEAALKFKKIDSSWNFIAIGNEARKEIFPDKNIVKEIGYKKNSDVLKYYSKSEIAIGNSVWDEPLGRIAIEASSRKCLPIISNKGGLTESKNIALVLKKNTSTELVNILKNITKNKFLRRQKQKYFYKNNNFEIKTISKMLDSTRSESIKNKKEKYLSNKRRILHIANFNENSDGRLFYSFANKLNNGFIKSNHIVETISNRSFLKSNRSIIQPFSPLKKFNEKIFNTIKNFSPHIIIIGHVFNINDEVFEYCKENNIKICSWFIDSVSPEFLKENTKSNFLRNLEFVDYCFLTSSPKIFKKNKNFKKLKFIPNPVDSAIDHYKNYKNNYNEYDIFVAISHGQNRGILKKGKSDERERFINKIISGLPQLKFAHFGLNNFEPVWGSNYYHYLSKSKIGLNISRGKYQNKYSSDRISSLIGNGLLVFINQNTNFQKILSKKDVVYFKNEKDLIKKLNYFTMNDKQRIKIAKSGCEKYHKHMNNIVVSNYILSCVGLVNVKKPFWHSIVE
ncbi:glycosyltransferase family 4 protein [Candidatus Pelagibacter sp.]|nr:glycosyltransferase family 4 protein [Candidatus Pelagibacter sp.]